MKYKIGDRVYWVYLGRKLTVTKVGFTKDVYECAYDSPPYEVIGIFKAHELKPIVRCSNDH